MTYDVVGRFAERKQFLSPVREADEGAHTVRRTPRASSPGGSERIMSPTRISNPDLDDLPADPTNDSARSVPDTERHVRLADRLNEAELEVIIQASALRLQSLVLVQASFEDDSEIAYAEEEA
jgi:hypothetical protein